MILVAAALLAPMILILACCWKRTRGHVPRWIALAPAPGLLAALLARGSPVVVIGDSPGRLTFFLDTPGAILLGSAALLWMAGGVFAEFSLRGEPHRLRFTICWLLSMAGSFGVFMAADLASFLLAFTLASLPAYGLIIHDGTAPAGRAGAISVNLALLSETFLLTGFVLLVASSPGSNPSMREAVPALVTSPWRDLTIACLVAGFAIKIGLFPVHFWLPLAHPAAPAAGSAVLSGVLIKAGVIGLIRFIPFDSSLSSWGLVLTLAGFGTALYAVAVGITQSSPKAILAYSSVSQMGVVAAILGVGLTAGDSGAGVIAAFYVAHHVLVKGALFLAVGVAASTGARRFSRAVFWPAAWIALGLAGLPCTGGALAKWVTKGVFGGGAAGLFAAASATGTALLMFHFLYRLSLAVNARANAMAPPQMAIPWLFLAGASVAVPWAMFLVGRFGTVFDVLSPDALWEMSVPILGGGLLALALRKWGRCLPVIPNGDIVVLGRGLSPLAATSGRGFQIVETGLRLWPVSCLSLLLIVTLLAWACGFIFPALPFF